MKKIYQRRNPYWLSDIFIFMEYDFEYEEKHVVWVKINSRNNIEEYGIDFTSFSFIAPSRCLNGDYINDKHTAPASKLQRKIINRFDGNFWFMIYSRMKLKQDDENKVSNNQK